MEKGLDEISPSGYLYCHSETTFVSFFPVVINDRLNLFKTPFPKNTSEILSALISGSYLVIFYFL